MAKGKATNCTNNNAVIKSEDSNNQSQDDSDVEEFVYLCSVTGGEAEEEENEGLDVDKLCHFIKAAQAQFLDLIRQKGESQEWKVLKKDAKVQSNNKAKQYQVTDKTKCIYCEVSYVSVVRIERHILEVHSEDPDLEPTFQCTECPDIFWTQGNLRAHLLQEHPVLSESYCKICDLRFKENEHLDGDRHTTKIKRNHLS